MKKLLLFLRDPPLWFAAVQWSLTLLFVGGSIAAVARGVRAAWADAVYALVALFALQITLVAVMGEQDGAMRFLNIAMGFFVCVLVIALGIYMIVRAQTWLHRQKEESDVQG